MTKQKIQPLLFLIPLAFIAILTLTFVSASQPFDFKIDDQGYFWGKEEFYLYEGQTLTFLSSNSPSSATTFTMAPGAEGAVNVIGKSGVAYKNLYLDLVMEKGDATLNITNLNLKSDECILLAQSYDGENQTLTLKLNGSNVFELGAYDDFFIYTTSSLKIKGKGSLKLDLTDVAQGASGGFYSEGDVDIADEAALTFLGRNELDAGGNITIREGASITPDPNASYDFSLFAYGTVEIAPSAGLIYIRADYAYGYDDAYSYDAYYFASGNIREIKEGEAEAYNVPGGVPVKRIRVDGNPAFRTGDIVEVRVPAGKGYSEYVYRSPIASVLIDASAYLWLPEGEYDFTASGYVSAKAKVGAQNSAGLTLTKTTPSAAPTQKPSASATQKPTTAKTTTASPNSQFSFRDVNKSDWFYSAVSYAVRRGLFVGATGGDFKPNAGTTRAVLTVLIARLNGADVSGYASSSFADVAQGKSYLPYVEWAKANGIVFGTSAATFEPDRTVRREELAAILLRYADFLGIDATVVRKRERFADYNKISQYAKYAAEVLQNFDVISGKPGNIFDPTAPVTRAETAQMFLAFEKNILGI
jgi:hypothetical protein